MLIVIYAQVYSFITYRITGGGGEARQRACCGGHIIGTSRPCRVEVFRLFFAYILKIMAEGSPLAQWKYKLYTKKCWFIIMYGFRGLRSTIVCINRRACCRRSLGNVPLFRRRRRPYTLCVGYLWAYNFCGYKKAINAPATRRFSAIILHYISISFICTHLSIS